jgi:DNA-binding response OmpR family regulator
VLQPPLIAVVHDDLRTRELLDNLLTDAGYRTFLWGRASEAHGLIRQIQPDLVILADLWLDHPTAGEMVLGLLELDPGTQHIPVIICSAHTSVLQRRIQLFRQERYAIVAKPCAPADLLAQIAAALQRGRTPDADAG